MKTKKTTLTIILLSGAFVLFIFSYFQHLLLPDVTFNNVPLHSTVEAIGALASILMGILLFQRQNLTGDYKLLWMIVGLLAIGVLDGFHAIVAPSNNFVLLHSSSVLLGGIFFSFMWFSGIEKITAFRKSILWFVVPVFFLLSIFILLSPETMPQMLHDGEFTAIAIFFNVFGGILYVAGATFLLKHFYRTSEAEFYWLATFSFLLGLGGITFMHGDIWTSAWWFWHILRLGAFIISLLLVIRIYYQNISDLQIAFGKGKQAEEALKEGEEKYRSMMESIDECAYISSPDFRVEYMNPAMVRRTGYDATGEPCHKAIHALSGKCPWCLHEKVQKGESCKTEILSPKDGLFYNSSSSPIYHVDGSISKMTIHADITERKRREEDLLVFHEFAEASGQGLGWGNLDGSIKYANRALSSMLGIERQEMSSGKKIETYYDKETWEKFEKEIFPTVLAEGQWMGELEMQSVKGTIIPTLSNIFTIKDGKGNPLFFANVVTDITERKLVEEEHMRLSAALEQAYDLVKILGPDGTVQYINPATEYVLGYKREEIVGQNPFHIKYKEDDALYNELKETISQGETWSGRQTNVKKDGTAIELESIISPIRGKSGNNEVDPLCCPKCAGSMKIIAFIEQPETVRRILKHVGLWEFKSRPPPKIHSPPEIDYVDIQYPDENYCDPDYPLEYYIN